MKQQKFEALKIWYVRYALIYKIMKPTSIVDPKSEAAKSEAAVKNRDIWCSNLALKGIRLPGP